MPDMIASNFLHAYVVVQAEGGGPDGPLYKVGDLRASQDAASVSPAVHRGPVLRALSPPLAPMMEASRPALSAPQSSPLKEAGEPLPPSSSPMTPETPSHHSHSGPSMEELRSWGSATLSAATEHPPPRSRPCAQHGTGEGGGFRAAGGCGAPQGLSLPSRSRSRPEMTCRSLGPRSRTRLCSGR